MEARAIGIIMVLVSGTAFADILGWQDADGVRHYTNVQDEIPKEHQQAAQVVVDEHVRQPAAAAAPCEPAAPAAEPRREAEVAYDRSTLAAAYIAGVERGLAAAGDTGNVDEGNRLAIHGPLAVANAANVAPYYGYPHYPWPYSYPLLTVPFDRGRSRYLTMRQLLDDQLQLERDYPFLLQPRLLRPFADARLGVPVAVGQLPQRLPNRVVDVVMP